MKCKRRVNYSPCLFTIHFLQTAAINFSSSAQMNPCEVLKVCHDDSERGKAIGIVMQRSHSADFSTVGFPKPIFSKR